MARGFSDDAQQIVGPEPREATFASSLVRRSYSVTPWSGQLNRWGACEIVKSVLSIFILILGTGVVLHAQTPAANPSPTPNWEALDWSKAEPAYDHMLRKPEWKLANDLYQILLVIKTGVTPEQRANIATILVSMVDGPRKPDADSLAAVTSDLVEGALLRKVTLKQRAELAIQVQFAMQGVNEKLLSNVNTSVAAINRIFNEGGMSAKRARKIVDDIYALVAKARAG